MCDFASFVLYKHPKEGWKVKSLDPTSHSPTVSAIAKELGYDFDKYAQVEWHDENTTEMQVLVGEGLGKKMTKEVITAEVLNISPTLVGLMQRFIADGYVPQSGHLHSAVQHKAWETLKVMIEAIPSERVLEMLVYAKAPMKFLRPHLKRLGQPYPLSEAIRLHHVDLVAELLKTQAPSKAALSNAIEGYDLEMAKVLAKSQHEFKMTNTNVDDLSRRCDKLKETDTAKIVLAKAGPGVQKKALYWFMQDGHYDAAKRLVDAGVRMNKPDLKDTNQGLREVYEKMVAKADAKAA